jgi:hypothetical protein
MVNGWKLTSEIGNTVDTTVVLSEVPETIVKVVYAVRVTVVANGDAWMRFVQSTAASIIGFDHSQMMLSNTLMQEDLL